MLVTALAKKLGYDTSAKIAKLAHDENISLKESALRLNALSASEYDSLVRPEEMLSPYKI